MAYVSGMVTRIRQGARPHLYITEWRELRGLSVEQLAGRVGVARETVWRWETQQHRLNPDKIAQLASSLDIEPEELWRRPQRQSLDALLKDATDAEHETAFDIVRRLARRAS
jgi:transcriptional regulator with XRE-family HTH domain